MEYSMRRLGWQWSLIHRRGVKETLYEFKVSPQHYHGALLDQIVRLDSMDLVFTLCRHPFDRLKSEYYWQLRNGLTGDGAPDAWLSRVLAQFADDAYSFDNHLRPQVDFLLPGHDCKVFRLEDNGVNQALLIANSLAPVGILGQWSIRIRPVWKNRSASIHQVERAFARLRPKIEAFYAADMARFGY